MPNTGNSIRKVRLEKIVAERLSDKLNQQIDLATIEIWSEVEPDVREVTADGEDLDVAAPRIRLEMERNEIRLLVVARIPLKRFLAWITGLSGLLIGLIKVLYLLRPIIELYSNKSPPLP